MNRLSGRSAFTITTNFLPFHDGHNLLKEKRKKKNVLHLPPSCFSVWSSPNHNSNFVLNVLSFTVGSLLHADIEIFLPEHPSQILSSTTTWKTGKENKSFQNAEMKVYNRKTNLIKKNKIKKKKSNRRSIHWTGYVRCRVPYINFFACQKLRYCQFYSYCVESKSLREKKEKGKKKWRKSAEYEKDRFI